MTKLKKNVASQEQSRNRLPPQMERALASIDGAVALLTEVNNQTAVICKVTAADLASFQGVPVQYGYELGLFPTGPVLCLVFQFRDGLTEPTMETFLNIAHSSDLHLAQQLADQDTLVFHLYDFSLHYHYSKQIQHRPQQREELSRMISLALQHLETVTNRDWYAARDEFYTERSR